MIFKDRKTSIPVVSLALLVRRPGNAGVNDDELAQIDPEGTEVSVFDKLEDENLDLVGSTGPRKQLLWQQHSKPITPTCKLKQRMLPSATGLLSSALRLCSLAANRSSRSTSPPCLATRAESCRSSTSGCVSRSA